MAYTKSIEHAARFLTRPLILALAPSSAALSTPPAQAPPAIGAGVSWVDWMALLAPREFALVITPRAVRVEYDGLHPHTVLVWADRTPAPAPAPTTKLAPAARPDPVEDQVPISRLGRRLQATVASAQARAQTPLCAPRALARGDSLAVAHARQLCARAACVWWLRVAAVHTGPPRTPSPATSSRPSSRSSMFSAGAESVSSASSVDECDTVKVKLAAAPAAREFVAPRRPLAPFHGSRATHVHAPAPAFIEEPETTLVVVDATKKEVTKYLYQGGVSTVLTGGVMLGAAPAFKSSPAPTATACYRAPAVARPPRHTQNADVNVGSWRRVAA
ncbi:hypothetical protein HYPSUDRAFT_210133 [Hypholoma sublateritium FD-334 SS-4]|uniref:Uncharacterized protein n=1 Tax=Hypholoma sublateritium (strain FD-334 SS-4) TaxID=945553 RepID=A0A0D2N0R5_HYPSF|nr:hypothetical protein HYPSUDRAFT_210133 [Hypholoma sublateritium FD-334 SS-4]